MEFVQKSEKTEAPPRGVAPSTLIEQVRNTAPFVFEGALPERAYFEHLRAPERELSHFEYFRLCVSAHYATVATFVPTDVDNQIRFRLWSPLLEDGVIFAMAELALELREAAWDCAPVSRRLVACPRTGGSLSGHDGEWFSIAAGAYGALRRRCPERAAETAGAILREMDREAKIFEELRKARDGIGALRAATLIAHNLGDLERVFEMWGIPEEDPLRRAALERSGGQTLGRAGALNKLHMARENHRHFALRKPRSLRRDAKFLLPVGPFFDDWGQSLGASVRNGGLSPEEAGAIAEALVDGWEWLVKQKPEVPVGYARALAGIEQSFPGGLSGLGSYLPARVARTLKSGPLRLLVGVARARFETQWNQFGLRP